MIYELIGGNSLGLIDLCRGFTIFGPLESAFAKDDILLDLWAKEPVRPLFAFNWNLSLECLNTLRWSDRESPAVNCKGSKQS